MKKRIKPLLLQNKGMTLVEITVVLTILVLILGSLFILMNMVQASNAKITQRVDAQSQFRLMAQLLREDISTSQEVQLLVNISDIPATIPSGYTCIYAELDTATNIGTFYKKTGSTITAFDNPYPIKGLSLNYKTSTQSLVTLGVEMTADDGHDFYTIIALQNAGGITAPSTADNTYNVIIYKDPPTA